MRQEDTEPIQFFLVKSHWLNGSGIYAASDENSIGKRLYLGEGCHLQMDFMQRGAADSAGSVSLIYGQPGTGKSMTAFLFSLVEEVRNDKIVLRIHVRATGQENPAMIQYNVLLMNGNEFKEATCKGQAWIHEFVKTDWGVPDTHKQRIVLIDGYTAADALIYTKNEALEWKKTDQARNHLFLVSSMDAGPLILGKEESEIVEIPEFIQLPWKFEEYTRAISDSDFRNSVASSLSLGDSPAEELALNALKRKFFYAGSCARFMFSFKTERVISLLSNSLRSQDNLKLLTDINRGSCSRQLTLSSVAIIGHEHRGPVSQFVKQYIGHLYGVGPYLDMRGP